MKRIASLALLTITFGIFLPLVGCHTNTSPASDSRQTRLIADENLRLKGQAKQLETQNAKLAKDLDQCKKEHIALTEDNRKNASLAQENQQLKSDLNDAKLRADGLDYELKQCQNELAMPKDEKIKKLTQETKDAQDAAAFAMTTVREEGEKETKALRDENEQLKAQMQKLQDELKQLKEKAGTANP